MSYIENCKKEIEKLKKLKEELIDAEIGYMYEVEEEQNDAIDNLDEAINHLEKALKMLVEA